MGAEEYENISGAFAMLKLILIAEDDIKNGRFVDVKDFFKEFRNNKKN